jgi:hypothetical protein
MYRTDMEFIPGYGYRWLDGSRVYQEQELGPEGLPLGYRDRGKPWAYKASELYIASGSEGFWVMDRLGSYHRHPYKTHAAAENYLKYLQTP